MTLPQTYILLKNFAYVDAFSEPPKPGGDRAVMDFRGRKDLSPLDKARIARSGAVEVDADLLKEWREKRGSSAGAPSSSR